MKLLQRGVKKIELLNALEQLRKNLQIMHAKKDEIGTYPYVLRFLTTMMAFKDKYGTDMKELNYYSFGEPIFTARRQNLEKLQTRINDYYVRGRNNAEQSFWTTAKPGEDLTWENVFHGNDSLKQCEKTRCPRWINRPITYMDYYCEGIIKLIDSVLISYLRPKNPIVQRMYERKLWMQR